MRAQGRYGALGALGVVAGMAALTSPAWACSPNASIFYPGNVQAAPVPPGGVVTVEGVRFNGPDTEQKGGPVEILWNSMVGAPLASAGGLSFSVQVPIPATAVPGETYYINAVQRSVDDPSVSWKSTVAIEIAPLPETSEETSAGVDGSVDTSTGEATTGETTTGETTTGETTTGETTTGESGVAATPSWVTPSLGTPPQVAPPKVFSPTSGGASGGPAVPPSTPAREAASPGSGSGSIIGVLVGQADGSQARLPELAAGRPGRVTPGSGRPTGPNLVPASPASPWTQPPSSAPAPSLFEPTDDSETRHPAQIPIGSGAFGIGLMAILGAGVVAGQRRLKLASRRR